MWTVLLAHDLLVFSCYSKYSMEDIGLSFAVLFLDRPLVSRTEERIEKGDYFYGSG